MLCGNSYIRDMYSTTQYFDAIGPVKESMPQGALKDLIQCMYFANDWDDTGWDTFHHSTKECPKDGTDQHLEKQGYLEDAYNKR